ncbi:hypothetical protein BASA81_000129 [Batrachochytrium salamandrivorans]|nr:hypothetical protein BASA81_000129 [Batrachochytrium salamandrivorans]
MRVLILAAVMVVVGLASLGSATAVDQIVGFGFQSSGAVGQPNEFYELAFPALTGEATVQFEQFRGKVVLITNVASACGYTASNYEQLIELKKGHPDELEIVLIPSNDFGEQEPGAAGEIEQFIRAQGELAKDFVLLEKSKVNGPHQSKLVEWLKRITKSDGKDIKWNFETKFFVSKNGQLVSRYSDSFSPIKLKPTVEYFLKQEL